MKSKRRKTMKARRLLGLIGAAALVSSLFAGSATVAQAKVAKPTVLGTDVAGDWGAAVEPTIAPMGDALGQDLTSASITQDGENVNFIIGVNSLPPNGGAPEVSRYTWNFTVGKTHLELDGKWTNYSRGACDPTAGTCPPPRDPGQQPFTLRGDCVADTTTPVTLTLCQEFALVQATFDPATATITIPVPLEALKAKKGTKIVPGTNIFGGSISASPSAFLTSSAMPMDTLTVTKTFVVK
jgi:hypothetical protein